MNKKIKVIELLNLLAENKIKKFTKIKYGNTVYNIDFPNLCGIYPDGTTKASESLFSKISILQLNNEVEILEDEEIDIQGIKEMEYLEDYEADKTDIRLNRDKINEILKAVKQLDKKINKE